MKRKGIFFLCVFVKLHIRIVGFEFTISPPPTLMKEV